MTNSQPPQKTMSCASIAVAAFSTVVEWYDFTLYLYFATVLSRVFFGVGEAALSITLATFAVAYLLRPLGGFVFGHIGDRFGRRRTMLLSVALMTVTMLGTALLPTHAQVGALAGWLLFLLSRYSAAVFRCRSLCWNLPVRRWLGAICCNGKPVRN